MTRPRFEVVVHPNYDDEPIDLHVNGRPQGKIIRPMTPEEALELAQALNQAYWTWARRQPSWQRRKK